ncbi:DUF2956 domain-containing protein [Vibrio hepatarius]|uniref:DUF2956 domain-containing protein n=1 Tax=Vibrio hepatarius TaxID=171383 RepID=UPI001C0A217B|nr:DUF2956 domain-containing protein [Vibrio hepatarius]MBU2897351.1 DUF2956 domain-containing protein [Vibrio hepatarius]
MKSNFSPSIETQQEALKIAKATQKPGQTKEQTKLIAQGIEKGIVQYKKQHKEKTRQAGKAKKKAKKVKLVELDTKIQPNNENIQISVLQTKSPLIISWALLILSWIGFISYIAQL